MDYPSLPGPVQGPSKPGALVERNARLLLAAVRVAERQDAEAGGPTDVAVYFAVLGITRDGHGVDQAVGVFHGPFRRLAQNLPMLSLLIECFRH